ncbi:MAG TPA: hypothetical protein VKP65_19470 [Rhodothermales bacterium]|nr:hypothetical protein [Rhodothermales bacterium]
MRISFGGGGTDVNPYAAERGGHILNATINRYAYVTLIPNDTGTIRLQSLDYGDVVTYAAEDDIPPYNFQMDLAKGVLKRLDVARQRTGFDLYTHTDCPPGSGLGASSTMVVALIGAFDHWLQLGLNRYETARLAFEIEREDLGIKGGKQDQYAATFGGFNFMEFKGTDVLVNPLRVPPEWIGELEYALVLAYTGQSRYSSDIISDQIDNYERHADEAVEAMDRTKLLASEMKQALLTGQLERVGALLHEAWCVKKQMSRKISNPFIDELYEAARAEGALGGKVSGAGGGGFMFFFTGFDRRHRVVEALEERGAQVVHVGFTDVGMQTWIR